MYNLPEFKAKNHQHVIEFMRQHPFAILTGVDSQQKPVATHVPLLIRQDGDQLVLQGHIMRKTDHHKAFEQNSNVLAIFTGPHAYVSASWYSNPRQAGTWNYMTVHAKGEVKWGDDKMLHDVLYETTRLFENNNASPSLMEHLPKDYVDKLVHAIVAFEIVVTSIDHVFKLSQNKDEESYHNIIHHLQQGDDEAKAMAAVMQHNRS